MLLLVISLAFGSLVAAGNDPAVDLLTKGGPTAILVFVVLGFFTGKIVRGSELDRALAGEKKALDLVYKQAEIAQRALEAGEKK